MNGMLDVLGSLLLHVVPFLLVISLVVTIHELGHFWVARAFKVKVDQFSIGFGKRLWSRTDRHGIEWRVAALPLGGYVKFSGDLDASSVPDQAGLAELKARLIAEQGPGAERDHFHFKPIWQRALIVAAGPAANFILAAVLFTIVFSWVGEQVVAPRVAQVTAGTPAAAAGFQRGDLVLAIDGRPVTAADEVTRKVVLSAGEALAFDVRRGAETLRLTATPQRVMEQDEIAGRVRIARIGMALGPLSAADFTYRRLNPVEALGQGVAAIGDTLDTTLTYLGRILTGRESGDLLSGPLGIAKAAGGVTQQAVQAEGDLGLRSANLILTLLQFAALVSIGIGFVNLLPIPVLDGGHLVFYGYEAVARRPVPAPVQEAGFRVGLALLAGLMLFATWNDLQKLNLFAFLGGLAS